MAEKLIQVVCPRCGRQVAFDASAGRTVEPCPNCGGMVDVPQQGLDAASTTGREAAGSNDEGSNGPDAPAELTNGSRRTQWAMLVAAAIILVGAFVALVLFAMG